MKVLRVTFPNGIQYDIPVEVIARHRAAYYADEFEGDAERSYQEDTLPLFWQDPYEAEDWAENNMDWNDVFTHARQVDPKPMTSRDYELGWIDGEKELVDL
jgi:hypothetical protein